MRLATTIMCVLALVVIGCGQDKEPQPSPEQIAQQKVQQALAAGEGGETPQGATVEVEPGGSEFDPPVELHQLPAGVWYCDMGTAHYARHEEGDGKCPVCGMTLSHKGGG